jgi:hypothetical protein
MLAVLVEKADPTGESRVRERDRGRALAGKSTLNRLELTKAAVAEEERYKKIVLDMEAVDRLLVEIFLEASATPPQGVWRNCKRSWRRFGRSGPRCGSRCAAMGGFAARK